MVASQTKIVRGSDYLAYRFNAMASPCEVLVESSDQQLVAQIGQLVAQEAKRIEHKFSRYRDDNLVFKINHAAGRRITVDEETARLIDFAFQCYQISDGLFDISAGVLREAWRFDGKHSVPSQQQIDRLLPLIGLEKIAWSNSQITLPENMQLDFGGIGKEYAVDRCSQLVRSKYDVATLINFGGDMAVCRAREAGQHWRVGIEDSENNQQLSRKIKLRQGAIATSGDARKHIWFQQQRYGHIINPKTGWPTPHSPHSVTVIADACLDAGILSTLAILQGENAETFLTEQGIEFYCQR